MSTPWQYPFDPLPKQREALIADVDEVLYGGSLGSGKSEVLLAACMTVCTLIPNAKALLVRRTYPELAELIKRLRERIPLKVASLNKSEYTFHFANGAELVLGYLNGPDDATRYQGHEFVLVCFDELTHYDKESYVLLMSRLRATGQVARDMKRYGLALRALSASNPGSKGHMWVKQRFIDPAPKHTVFTGTEDGDHTRRIFIPARIYDNPYLDHVDYLRKLGPMDPELKRAMVEGDWDIVSGVRFGQWRESVHVIDPAMIPISPIGYPRAVGVDYGLSAPFAALWGAKLSDDLIVVYREVGGAGYTPAQQAAMIRDAEAQDERRPERPIPIALDSACWARDPNQVQFGALAKDIPPPGSIASYYRDVFGDQVVKSKKDRIGGWALIDHHLHVREDGLPRILVYNTCRELIRTLPSLPRAKNNPEDLDTHGEDHYCFTGDTLIQTSTGRRRIDHVQVGELVATRQGWRPVTESMMTDPNATVGTVVMSDGTRLRGTANHPVILTNNSVVRMDALRYSDTIVSWGKVKQSYTRGSSFGVTRNPINGPKRPTMFRPETTAKTVSEGFTKKSGRTLTGLFRLACRFITGTITRSITTSATSNSPLSPRTAATTPVNPRTWPNLWKASPLRALKLQNGTAAPKALHGIRKRARSRGKAESLASTPANTVASSTNPSSLPGTGSAPTTAKPRHAASPASITSPGLVNTVGNSSTSTSTPKRSPATVNVAQPWVADGVQPVYNLTVEGVHEYFANGVLVHNCDALRYLVQELTGKTMPTKADPRDLYRRPETVTGSLVGAGF